MDQAEKEVTIEQRIAELQLAANCASLLAAKEKASKTTLLIVCIAFGIIITAGIVYYQSRIKALEDEIEKIKRKNDSDKGKL